jgi:hypothetical protein
MHNCDPSCNHGSGKADDPIGMILPVSTPTTLTIPVRVVY